MANKAHNARKGRESLSKKLGKVAKQIRIRDNDRCAYCSRNAIESGAHLHLDHIICRSEGGSDTAQNLTLACINCNSSRKNLDFAAWCAKAASVGILFDGAAILAKIQQPLPELPKTARKAA